MINIDLTKENGLNIEFIGQVIGADGTLLDYLNKGYIYVGTATPSTTPMEITAKDKVFYIAVEVGDYTGFGQNGITELTILKSDNGGWVKEGLGVPFRLAEKIDGLIPLKQLTETINPNKITGKVVNTGGVIVDSEQYAYYAPVLLEAGKVIVLNEGESMYLGYNVAVLYECDSSGSYIRDIISGNRTSATNVHYINDTGEDMYVGISCYINQLVYHIAETTTPAQYTDLKCDELEEDIKKDLKQGLLIYEKAFESSYNFYENIDVSQDMVGTQYRVEIMDMSGEGIPYINFLKGGTSFGDIISSRIDLHYVGVHYISKTTESEYLRLYKPKNSDGSTQTFTVKVYKIIPSFSVANTNMPAYVSRRNQEFSLGDPFYGYWNQTDPQTILNSPEWICFQKQYITGLQFYIDTDFEQYYVALKIYANDLQSYSEVRITDNSVISTDGFVCWHLQVRRIDRVPIPMEEIDDIFKVIVVGSQTLYERPITVSESLEQIAEVEHKISTIARPYIVNPFATNPYYAHYAANTFIKDGQGRNAIASESLEDIAMMARLGYTIIEANIHQNASGDFVVIHGNTGEGAVTFGNEVIDISTQQLGSEIVISETTTEYMKTNIRYNSDIAKYRSSVPTLEEFCQCCKENNIGLFAGTANADAIAICRKYFGDDVILYNPPTSVRNDVDFRGLIFRWNNRADNTPEGLLAQAETTGAPFMCGLGPTPLANFKNNEQLDDFIAQMHNKGYLVGIAAVYQNEEEVRDFFRRGGDFAAAGHEVNPFESNYELFDIDYPESITTTGEIADGVATLTDSQTITCGSTSAIPLGKGSLVVRFSGTIEVLFGSQSTRTITSDGTEYINVTDYFLNKDTQLVITASGNVNITSLVYKTSKC